MTGLARCVCDVQGFLQGYWSRAPVHSEGMDPGGFGDLLSLDDVDRFVSSWSLRLPAFRLVRDGRPLDPSRYTRTARIGSQSIAGVADPPRIFDELRGGATIVFQALQRSWLPLTRFCRALELELSHSAQANAYVTPAGSRGLGVHYDTHDVFVLQLAGTKQWSIYQPALEDPLPSQPWKGPAGAEVADPCLSVTLRAGDSLYVPRGFLHSARAQEDLSAHLTIGVVTTTWYDVVRDLVSATADDPSFRRPLPVGFASDEAALALEVDQAVGRLRKWLDQVDAQAVAASTAGRFWDERPPILAGQLHQIGLLDEIDDSSRLCPSEGSVCCLSLDGDTLAARIGGRELHMPAALEPTMRRIVTSGPFRLGDLAELIDGPSRLVLARRLVGEGLLQIVHVG